MQKWNDETPIRPTYWNRNKGVILGTLAAVATATVVVQRVALARHDKYLVEKGLAEDYYITRHKK